MPSASGSTEEHQVPLKEGGRRGVKETEVGLRVGWVLLESVERLLQPRTLSRFGVSSALRDMPCLRRI